MELKTFFEQLNIPAQCKKYDLSLWQCPQFLFLIMGVIIILTIITSYVVANKYIVDPASVALIVIALSMVLFILTFIIVRSFEKLAEASRIKSEFINIVSHQLRTPLSNLSWALETLMSGRLGKIEERQNQYFEILNENSTRMRELLDDLLIVSQIESDRLLIKKTEFSIEDLVKELIVKFTPFARASKVEIKLEIEKNLPKVFADFSKIRLVISKLLNNAICYNKSGGKVKIEIKKKLGFLNFEIEDTGVGIPKEEQKYIFQKLFRTANILRYQTSGIGLGLYIAKSIIEKSGGKIAFKSEENKGSKFWFTLPLK